MIIKQKEIENFDQRYRTTFVNSLGGFRQALLVGTKSKEGHSNLAIFNSLMHIGANPALFGLISRPDSVPRDTLENISDTGEYTLNFVKSSDHKKAHQTSARYYKNISEFEQVGFEEYYFADCDAPAVREAVVKIAMKLEEKIPIRLNGTIMIIGSIQQIEIQDGLICEDGFVSLSDAQVLISQGLDAYFDSKFIGREPYAKPQI
jgi:flavin reductase (DIM6/NTAB) family NADH-FMN oxidoreductase RutF